MTKLGITHMVSVMENMPTTMPDVVRHHVPIADKWNADILKYLDGTTDFIKAALAENENNKVLVCYWVDNLAKLNILSKSLIQVHCFQGISRSATVVCAYIIAQAANGMTAAEAIDIVRAKRGIVCPNDGFRCQLAIYSERFVGKRGKQSPKEVSPETRRPSKISEGIADRIRRLKAGGVMASASPLQQVEVEESG